MALAPVIYFRWTPEWITITKSSGGEPLREPPDVVVNPKRRIAAIGQEARAEAAKPGMRFASFPSVEAAWQERELAGALFRFYWYTVEYQGRPAWHMLLARWWPPLRSYLVIHPAEGAEVGLEVPQAQWLRGLFHNRGRTFVWSGPTLDPTARLSDTRGRGHWLAGDAPLPI